MSGPVKKSLIGLFFVLACAEATFSRVGGDEAARYYFVTAAAGSDMRHVARAAVDVGAQVVGIAPEGRLVVRATDAQLDQLRSVADAADAVAVDLSERVETRERGLGARRPTREEWEAIRPTFLSIEHVEPNELAILREWLDGAATVDNSVSQYFPPIRSQGSQGSCTAWAAGYYYNTYVQARDGGWNVSSGDNSQICSPAFLYPLENDGVDEGAYTYSVVRRLNDVGCASWAIVPYSASDWTTWPDEAQWVEALPRRTLASYSIGNGSLNGCSTSEFATIKQLLANGEVLVTDTDVHSTWYDYYPRTTNGINNAVLYAIDGDYLGGHAMTIVGYDDTRTYFDGSTTRTGAFLLANSWGSWWGASNTVGQRGYMWVSYTLFTNYNGYFGVAYYNSDRTNYAPRMYAVSGVNHAKRSYVRYRGGVGPSASPQWISYSVVSNNGGASLAVTNNRRLAADLTDGMSYITNLASVRLYSELRIRVAAGSAGTLTSADFFHDLDGDGLFAVASSSDPVVTVNPNNTGFATVQFNAAADTNLYVTITNPASDLTVPYTTTTWTVAGLCGTSAVGQLTWTNWLTGEGGAVAAGPAWSIPEITLEVGTNVVSVKTTNSPAAAEIARDAPTNAWYGDGWHSNDNGGFGFGVWSLAAGANAGHFIANSTANTNLEIAPTAWGLWANSGDTASAARFFAQPMKVGGRFTLKFENHWVDSGRSVGVAWRNVLGEYLVEFLFLGGGTNYLLNDQTTSRPTGISFTENGLDLVFELTGTNTYRLSIGTQTIEGTLKARTNMEVRQFYVWNYSAGGGSAYDVFIADLSMWEPAPAGTNAVDTVTIVREPPAYCVWEVRSSWGAPQPPVGVYTSLFGTILTNQVSAFDTRDSTQYECVGWSLLNHEPSSGTSNEFALTLTNHTVVTWLWVTNYALGTSADAHGTVAPTSGWFRAGSNVTVTAYPDPYWHFAGWTGDVPAGAETSNPVVLAMDAPRSIHARFAEDTTTEHQTPHWWLADYGWTSDFETAESEDADGDGYATWQEWIALTDPTDSDDALVVRAADANPLAYVITWPGRSNRTYWITIQTNVAAEPEAVIGPITGPQSEYTDTVYQILSPVLYRIGVER